MEKYIIQNSSRHLAAQQGFTLIEILIALVIFSVGILGVAMMQIRSTASNTTAGNVSANVAVSVDQVEKLMTSDYDTIATGDVPIDVANDTGNITTLEWNVIETVPGGSDLYSYKTVTVNINRNTPYGEKPMTLQRNIPNIVGD